MSTVKQLENTTFYCGPNGYMSKGGSYNILLQNYNTYPSNNSYIGNTQLVWFGMKQGETIIDVFTYLENQGYNTNGNDIKLEVEGGDSKCYCFLYNTATSPGGDEYKLGIEPNIYITQSDIDREIKFKWKGQYVFKFIQYGKTYVYCSLINITFINKSIYLVHDADNEIFMSKTPIPAMTFSYSGNRIFYHTNRSKTLNNDNTLIFVAGNDILSGLSTKDFQSIPTYIGEYNTIDNSVKRVKFDPSLMNEIGFFVFSSTTQSYLKQASIDISRMSKYYVNE